MPDPVTRLNDALEGRYHVEGQVGEGGMATVYVARDLRHHRKVALKVLRPELAAALGAERFLAEIETTANLQHPHILPLYDSGQAGSYLFYVMPYVEGETLRQRLDREKQLPVDEAVRIATAVAGALDYAHRHGVVHRDVKPGNILMHDGQPVVGDFGIALAVGAAGGARLTETGIGVGTPHYMSPEQATGERTVGPPSDIWALGAVLYEMLTGEPPYTGATAQALLGRIIQGAPVSATEARSSVPPNVDAAIRKALEPLPADRFAGAQEFARALADPGFRHGAEAGVAPAAGWKRLAVGASAVAGALAVALVWSLLRLPPQTPPSSVERFRLDIVPSGVPAILPDGSGVVYNGSGQLLLRRWTDLESKPIPGTEGVGPNSTPVVSPSGAEVAYVAGDALEVAPLAGGVVRTLADSADCCARWGPDDFIYYRTTAQNIDRVPASGGVVEVVMEREVGSLGDFQVLPGGEVAVFSEWSDPPHIEAVRLATGERTVLTPGVKPYVTSGGYLVFGSVAGQILAAPFDADALELTGPEIPLVDGVMVALDYPIYSLSETGTLVYAASAAVNSLQFVWVTRSGQVSPLAGGQPFRPSLTSGGWRRLSPDGGRIAFGRRENGNDDVWIEELRDGRTSRLTFGDAPDTRPEWAPDGRSITYRSGSPDRGRLWSKAADGTGEAELLFDGFDVTNGVWSPDGTWLVLQRGGHGANDPARDILATRPGVDTTVVPLVASPEAEEVAPAISRDGRWLAYGSNETGRHEIYVRPFPDVDGGRWQVSTEGGVQPVWAHNRRELFFIDPRTRELVAAEFSTAGGTFLPGPLTTLFPLPPLTGGAFGPEAPRVASYDISVDDSRFLMARAYEPEDAPVSAILVRNLLAGLEARVRD